MRATMTEVHQRGSMDDTKALVLYVGGEGRRQKNLLH